MSNNINKLLLKIQKLDSTCDSACLFVNKYANEGDHEDLVSCYTMLTDIRRLVYELQAIVRSLPPSPNHPQLPIRLPKI